MSTKRIIHLAPIAVHVRHDTASNKCKGDVTAKYAINDSSIVVHLTCDACGPVSVKDVSTVRPLYLGEIE